MNNHNYLINPFYQFVTPVERLAAQARQLLSRPKSSDASHIHFKTTATENTEPRTDISPEFLKEKPWLRYYPSGMPLDLKPDDETLPGMLRDSARRFPAQTAIIFYGHKISYKDLDAAADSFALSLVAQGIKPGDRVALLLPNCPICDCLLRRTADRGDCGSLQPALCRT